MASLLYKEPTSKAPADILDYPIDATAWLATGEQIASCVVSIAGSDAALVKGGGGAPSDPVLSEDGLQVTQWLSAGTAAVDYRVHYDLTTTATPARTVRATLIVPVR